MRLMLFSLMTLLVLLLMPAHAGASTETLNTMLNATPTLEVTQAEALPLMVEDTVLLRRLGGGMVEVDGFIIDGLYEDGSHEQLTESEATETFALGFTIAFID